MFILYLIVVLTTGDSRLEHVATVPSGDECIALANWRVAQRVTETPRATRVTPYCKRLSKE